MSEIKEDYVSFEVAKLLKEKGFNELCSRYYNSQFDEMRTVGDICMMNWNSISINDEFYYISIPTHQVAIKWLREKYNIYICIQPDFPSTKDYKMYWCWSANILHDNCISLKGYQCYIETYEKATEEAIKYCLENLI